MFFLSFKHFVDLYVLICRKTAELVVVGQIDYVLTENGELVAGDFTASDLEG